ncbi:MAG TPA: IS21-like element helper ATPase IstB [Candidatus Eisenbacteria bacterium]
MLNQATIDKMQAMKMSAMAEAFHRQIESGQWADLSFEERLGMLVDTEWTSREQKKLDRRLKTARLRYPASLEDVDYTANRGLDRQAVLALETCGWIKDHHNLILTGTTGTGKSYIACAFAERACRSGYGAAYYRTPRLLQELHVARGDGSYNRLMARLARVDLLALDDWLINPLKDQERRDLLEVIEDRNEKGSTLVTTQLPVKAWHEAIGDPTLADAICDRLIHRAHRIDLKGPSMRQAKSPVKKGAKAA